jgi:ABC-type transporter Mla subunit MlaD
MMQLHRNEIRTGIFVIVTFGIVIVLLLALGAPGVLRRMNTYYIFFDNAAGIKSGASVLLAGRKIGRVTKMESPIPSNMRPKDDKYEVVIEVKVDADAKIYNQVMVRMQQVSLLGEQIIDFAQGDEASGLALSKKVFFGERVPDATEASNKALKMLSPLVDQGVLTLRELKNTASNLGRMTAPGSELNVAVSQFKEVGGNVRQITNQVLENDNLERSLTNLRNLTGQLSETAANTKEFTDTLKHEPWRLIWPSRKKYPEDEAQEKLIAEKQRVLEEAEREEAIALKQEQEREIENSEHRSVRAGY